MESNKSVPQPKIIPINTKYDTPHIGAPISDDESSDYDFVVESLHTESEGNIFERVEPAVAPTPLPLEEPNIDIQGAKVPPNPSPEGANSYPDGDNSHNPVWTQNKDNRLKIFNLNI